MFFTVSPDPVTSVTCAEGEPALICQKHRASGGSASSDIQWPLAIGLHGDEEWAQGTLQDVEP